MLPASIQQGYFLTIPSLNKDILLLSDGITIINIPYFDVKLNWKKGVLPCVMSRKKCYFTVTFIFMASSPTVTVITAVPGNSPRIFPEELTYAIRILSDLYLIWLREKLKWA